LQTAYPAIAIKFLYLRINVKNAKHRLKVRAAYTIAKKFTLTLKLFLSKTLLPLLMAMLFLSLRKREKGNRLSLNNQKIIIAFWHGQMLTGWIYAKRLMPRGAPLHAVVSLSKDGVLLANALSVLGLRLIRGSSSKGKEAVKSEMRAALENGESIVITPDGPRGPKGVMKYGSIRLASESQTPVLFLKIHHRNAWRLKSWDAFEIPKPFSIVEIEPKLIAVPRFANEDELKAFCETKREEKC
jgi:lysophospholipid acyltransferase (LPLAT)-like uncharacterized protein